MRFLLDEDLSPLVAEVARRLGIDAISVHDLGRQGLSDEVQLRFAASQGRLLVTRNRDDFITLTRSFFDSGEPHAGVLIVPRSLPGDRPEAIARALERWCERMAAVGDPGPYLIDFLGR